MYSPIIFPSISAFFAEKGSHALMCRISLNGAAKGEFCASHWWRQCQKGTEMRRVVAGA